MNSPRPFINGPKLSAAAVWWFYVGLGLASLVYLLLLGVSGYGALFEPRREFFMHLMLFLAGLNGLAAVGLALRRKPLGAYWSLIPAALVGLSSMDVGQGSAMASGDVVPMTILLGLTLASLLGQLPTLNKIKELGAGWGLGAAQGPARAVNRGGSGPEGVPASRAAVWWFRVSCSLSLLFYLGISAGTVAFLINDPPRSAYSLYMAIIAGAFGLYALGLTWGKNTAGPVWSLAACFFLILGLINIGLGKPLRGYTSNMLPFAVLMSVILLSQLPYLKRFPKRPRGARRTNFFRKENFTSGASLSNDDLADLRRAWLGYSLSFGTFFLPGFAFALFGGHLLSRGVGGVVGNFLAVALLFGVMFLALFISRGRKKRYLACLGQLGLTEEDVKQAMLKQQAAPAADNVDPT